MKGFTVIFALACSLFFVVSCKKDTNPTNTATSQMAKYEVAFNLYSSQPEFEFIYNDINGTHIDTIFANTDSISTVVETGSNMQFEQKIQCLDTIVADRLIMTVHMNGKIVTDSASKAGNGKLVVGLQLQSLL